MFLRRPARLKKPEREAWNEMRAEGFWLTSADSFMIEVASGLMAEQRAGEIDNPARSLLISTLSKLGFGPTERSKLKVPEARPPHSHRAMPNNFAHRFVSHSVNGPVLNSSLE
jgi:hypothetical protein